MIVLFIHSKVLWPEQLKQELAQVKSIRLTWKPFTLYPYTRGIIDKEVMRQVFHRAVLNIVGGQGTGLVF